VFLH